jgi:4-hydroxybenzoate polyprenyltransferase
MPLTQQLREYAELVKLEHTIFALPFALSAMLLACPPDTWPLGTTVIWIIAAMVGGRTYAMALNRLLDAAFDAQNPRTASRGIPAGRVSRAEAWTLTALAAGLFMTATRQLPPLCLQLLPLAFVILTLYSFTKRFTSLAHLVLGMALGSAAVGGWLAVTGTWNWLAVLFGWVVVFWVSGFDVIYACQDTEFDQHHGLSSIPAKLGIPTALKLSKAFHVTCITLLVAFGLLYGQTTSLLGWGFWIASTILAGLLLWEHRLVRPDRLDQINMAFFTLNGWVSMTMLAGILADKLAATPFSFAR